MEIDELRAMLANRQKQIDELRRARLKASAWWPAPSR
jgi:hypothetical protein